MRTAPLTLRLQAVTLRPPRHRSAKHLAAVAVTAVWAHEARQRETADRHERCRTRYSVIAWRVRSATRRARAAPELSCPVLLDPDAGPALDGVIQQTPAPPTTPPSLRQAVRWIAQLGGCLARSSDGAPGPIVLWRGVQHLADLTAMYRVRKPRHQAQTCGES